MIIRASEQPNSNIYFSFVYKLVIESEDTPSIKQLYNKSLLNRLSLIEVTRYNLLVKIHLRWHTTI